MGSSEDQFQLSFSKTFFQERTFVFHLKEEKNCREKEKRKNENFLLDSRPNEARNQTKKLFEKKSRLCQIYCIVQKGRNGTFLEPWSLENLCLKPH